ncbi:hypothetical protein CH372_17060 [Leptospira meyeri]|uniref:restriction endonuclease subunit S n=1 Tax=Leptospira meyeri TaxID=29508 RepID=UPI000C299FBD|nr:restriction endonuclease subunit S [Leptospira meyeri]PKA10890.1 hypothetical protein CH372_17060 [Leptospira meyeri]PKA22344.1 hypothetical protein CH381_31390 [Leptospira sp. mixed culture ATI2-C-A1]
MKFVPITEVCDFQGGTQPPKEEWENQSKPGYVRMLQIRDFTQKKIEHIEYVKISNKIKTCESDDILIGRYGASIGKILTGLSGAYNVAIVKTLPNEGKLSKPFLYYVLKDSRFQSFIGQIGGRAAQAGFNKDDLTNFQIPLPPLPEQIAIANILSKTEGLIAKRKESLALLDAYLKSTFLEMFGDPVRNEKGWEVKRLGDGSKLQGGFAFKSKDLNDIEGIKLLKIANVHFEKTDWSEMTYLPNNFLAKYSEYSLNTGDLVIALTRPIIKSLNAVKAVRIAESDLPCLLNQRVARFELDKSVFSTLYFQSFVYTDYFKNEIARLCSTALQPNISTSQIENITIPFPPLELQNQFAEVVEKVEVLKEKYQKSLGELENLYGSLSQRAFRGEL